MRALNFEKKLLPIEIKKGANLKCAHNSEEYTASIYFLPEIIYSLAAKQPNKSSSALTAYYHHVYYHRLEMDYFELIEMMENESREKKCC